MNEQVLNIKFVQEVEKYPCLYNYKLSDYSRKYVTENAWREVGKVFNMSESQAKEKWRNLRAVFVRHIKQAPGGSSSKYRKPYYLADAMQFTIPFVKTLNACNSGNLHQEEKIDPLDNQEANEEYLVQQNIPSPLTYPQPASSPLSNQPLSPASSHSSTSSGVDEVIRDYFNAKKAKLEKKSEVLEDPKRMFLLSLLPDLKAMSDSETRTFKRRALALVDEILGESPRPLPAAPSQQATAAHNVETQSNVVFKEELNLSD